MDTTSVTGAMTSLQKLKPARFCTSLMSNCVPFCSTANAELQMNGMPVVRAPRTHTGSTQTTD